MTLRLDVADCIDWLDSLPADSVDLVFGSPPYEDARTYGIDFRLKGQDWVDWMVKVYRAASRVCRGLVAFVVEGKTRGYRWSATPSLLEADLHRAGFHVRRPAHFHRVGIPGSGGPDWLRGDLERIVCIARPGRLPWSDNKVMGHPPKWAPGGELSYRLTDGTRRNQWGGSCGPNATRQRRQNGDRQPGDRPSHVQVKRGAVSGYANGDTKQNGVYVPPAIANPGNVIQRTYTADEVAELLAAAADVVHCKVGGGQMGHELAHLNEAPFPLPLAEFFVRSFCRPGGVACDPFLGSGTTPEAALRWGRQFWGCDLRAAQVKNARRRLRTIGRTAL